MKKHSGQFQKGMTPWNKGKQADEATKKRLQSYNVNRIRTKEAIEKHKESMKKKQNDPNRSRSKASSHARRWRKAVKDRDGWKCVNCGNDKMVGAHHIVPWNVSEELRFELSNGITLCNSCHMIIENKEYPKQGYWKGKKLSEEHKHKLRLAKIGRGPWNKGLKYSK